VAVVLCGDLRKGKPIFDTDHTIFDIHSDGLCQKDNSKLKKIKFNNACFGFSFFALNGDSA